MFTPLYGRKIEIVEHKDGKVGVNLKKSHKNKKAKRLLGYVNGKRTIVTEL